MRYIFLCIISFIFLSMSYANETIAIGTIYTKEIKKKHLEFTALAKYLEKKLNRKNLKIDVLLHKNIKETISSIHSDKLHIFIDSVYPTILIQEKTNITIESNRWKKGQEGYKSIVFVKIHSDIKTAKDLKGKTIAFEDMFSTSGFYIPKLMLEKNALIISNNNNQDNLKYVFAKTENNVQSWVLYGKVDAGAASEKDFNEINKNHFKVILKSELIPRNLVSFSQNIDFKLKQDILHILFTMHKNKEGKKVLKFFSKTAKFMPLNRDNIEFIKKYEND